MKNSPNVYKVQYEVMEGDNYAGGLVEKVMFVSDVGSVRNMYGKITSITPAYLELSDTPLTTEEIQKAFKEAHRVDQIEMVDNQIEEAKRLLSEAEARRLAL